LNKKPFSEEQLEVLQLLAEKFPTVEQVCAEIINLQALLNLPKGTEYFMSDLHGEYEAFRHILNNCSGIIKEKVQFVFRDRLSETEQNELCTLIYYPEQKLARLKKSKQATDAWYNDTLWQLIELSRVISAKYSRSKVRKAMPEAYRFILDELLHAQPEEGSSQYIYQGKIIETVIRLKNGDDMIFALSELIKQLSVDHLHIVGDIFDRGPRPDTILDYLMNHHSVDIEWGNHDIPWMGAAAGSEACIASVVRNCLSYKNTQVLESGYGITLRPLVLVAEKLYPEFSDPLDAAYYAISIILFKLEAQIILRNPHYEMEEQILLDKIDFGLSQVEIDEKWYDLKYKYFQTVQPERPFVLSDGEKQILNQLKNDFLESTKLAAHVQFLYENGSMYLLHNGNLLFHGCIPLNDDGTFTEVTRGGKRYKGKALLDYADRMARRAYFGERTQEELDYMWYLWCGYNSPVSGRRTKTFARMFIDDKVICEEPRNAYYLMQNSEEVCNRILEEFGLDLNDGHIINGHTPIHVKEGESPIKAGGKLLVIDGGFCKRYQQETGIAGYTLIYNSHGLRLLAHQPFLSMEKSIEENLDIAFQASDIKMFPQRKRIKDIDVGAMMKKQIMRLEQLLDAYRRGFISPKCIK